MSRRFLALLVAVVLGAASCSSGESTTTTFVPPTKLKVVATTSVLADFTRVLGGDYVEVYNVIKPGVEPHKYTLTADDYKAISEATVIVRNGVGLDPWVEAAVVEAGSKATVIDTSAEVTPRKSPYAADLQPDPHIWHSPQNAKLMADAVARALIAADDKNAAAFTINQRAYFAQLDGMTQDIRRELEAITTKKVVTAHASILYYLAEFGLEFVGSAIPSVDPHVVPIQPQNEELDAKIRAQGVKVLFTEQLLPSAPLEAFAANTGAKIVTGKDALYVDGLGASGSVADTYIKMERFNTSMLAKYLS